TQLVDELLNDSFVHGLVRSRSHSRGVRLLLDEARPQDFAHYSLAIAPVAGCAAPASRWATLRGGGCWSSGCTAGRWFFNGRGICWRLIGGRGIFVARVGIR